MTTGTNLRNHFLLLAVVLGISLFFLGARFFSESNVRPPDEIQIAFWSWRNEAPDGTEVRRVFEATNAKTLFLRAGQLEISGRTLNRIRPLRGRMPSSASLHLVYNGTREFLKEFEKLETDAIARAVAETFLSDLQRAGSDGAQVDGVQLDFDVPTRLLPKYTQVLQTFREFLPPDKELSITGLPTWTSSNDIEPLLDAVDFWIPQYYGASIPINVDQSVPISSARLVERAVGRTARLNKPFYAGLSAYGYAILYASDGSLIELRGDIDPATAAINEGLEPIERRPLEKVAETSEMRYAYRAKRDIVIDGLIIKPGEILAFDVPSAASLRESARAVRENGGSSLLGICIFRLPTANDETTLTLAEIQAALSDSSTKVSTTIVLTGRDRQLKLRATNIGTASTIIIEDALTIDLSVPQGTVSAVTGIKGIGSYETLCRSRPDVPPSPCSERRADILRLKVNAWKPASAAEATIKLNEKFPPKTTAVVTTRINDGRVERESIDLILMNE